MSYRVFCIGSRYISIFFGFLEGITVKDFQHCLMLFRLRVFFRFNDLWGAD